MRNKFNPISFDSFIRIFIISFCSYMIDDIYGKGVDVPDATTNTIIWSALCMLLLAVCISYISYPIISGILFKMEVGWWLNLTGQQKVNPYLAIDQAIEAEEYPLAKKLIEECIAADPRDCEAYLKLSVVYVYMKVTDNILQTFKKGTHLCQSSARLYMYTKQITQQLRFVQKNNYLAERIASFALQKFPEGNGYEEIENIIAEIMLDSGDYENK